MRSARTKLFCLATVVGLATLQCKPPQGSTHAAPDVATVYAPATRPINLLATAHFGSPKTTARRAQGLLARPIPLELGLSLMLGLDSTLVAAVDMDKPIDAVLLAPNPAHSDTDRPIQPGSPPAQTASETSEQYVLVLTPVAGSSFRSTLNARYRTTRVEGLGEILESRQEGRTGALPWHCAIIGVGGEVGSRIACSHAESALRSAGRWAAENARTQEQDSSDALMAVSGDSFRNLLLPMVERGVLTMVERMAQSAREARDQHTTPPDLGDPEALVTQLNGLAANIRIIGPDLRQISLASAVTPQELTIDGSLEYPTDSEATLAVDARARLGIATAHPLFGRLNPASWVVLGANAADGYFQRISANAITVALSVLGSRVARSEQMQTDWTELFAHLGTETALGCAIAPEPVQTRSGARGASRAASATGIPAFECTAIFAQTDEGVGARAVISRLARAPWLREMRFGTVAPVIAMQGSAIVLRLPPAPAQPLRPAGAQREGSSPAVTPPRELAITVSRGNLAVLYGSNVRAQLRGLDAQIAGPGPGVISGIAAPIVFAIDAHMGRAPERLVPLSLTVDATDRDRTLRTGIHIRIPGAAFQRAESRGL